MGQPAAVTAPCTTRGLNDYRLPYIPLLNILLLNRGAILRAQGASAVQMQSMSGAPWRRSEL